MRSGMQVLSCAVIRERTSVKVYAVRGGNAIRVEVFRVAVAHDDVEFARIERFIHFGDVIGAQKVVRVEKEISFEIFDAVIFLDSFEPEFERVTFARFGKIVPLVHGGAFCARDGGGFVRAVVRDHEHVQFVFGIILPRNAVQQVADDLFFVAGADHYGVTMFLFSY